MVSCGWNGRDRSLLVVGDADDQFIIEYCVPDPDPDPCVHDAQGRGADEIQGSSDDVCGPTLYYRSRERRAVLFCQSDLRRVVADYDDGGNLRCSRCVRGIFDVGANVSIAYQR